MMVRIKLTRLDVFFLGVAFPLADRIGWPPLHRVVRFSRRVAEDLSNVTMSQILYRKH